MKTATWIVLSAFLMMTGCSYEQTYRDYALAQSKMAMSSGPLLELYEDGKIKSVGNPLVSLAAMQMKPPKDAWEYVFDTLRAIAPFGFMWGIIGTLSTASRGTTMNVTGEGNLVGNQAGAAGGASSWASPVTTTTTTVEAGEGVIFNPVPVE